MQTTHSINARRYVYGAGDESNFMKLKENWDSAFLSSQWVSTKNDSVPPPWVAQQQKWFPREPYSKGKYHASPFGDRKVLNIPSASLFLEMCSCWGTPPRSSKTWSKNYWQIIGPEMQGESRIAWQRFDYKLYLSQFFCLSHVSQDLQDNGKMTIDCRKLKDYTKTQCNLQAHSYSLKTDQ